MVPEYDIPAGGLEAYLVGVGGVHLGYQIRPPLSVRVEASDTERILGAVGRVEALRMRFSYFLQALAPLRIGMLLSSARALLKHSVPSAAYLERGRFSPRGLANHDFRVVIFEDPEQSREGRVVARLSAEREALRPSAQQGRGARLARQMICTHISWMRYGRTCLRRVIKASKWHNCGLSQVNGHSHGLGVWWRLPTHTEEQQCREG